MFLVCSGLKFKSELQYTYIHSFILGKSGTTENKCPEKL